MATGTIKRTLFQDVEYTYNYSVAANSFLSISDADLGISTPSGYTPVGIMAAYTGAGDVVIRNIGVSGDNNSIKSVASVTRTGKFGIVIRYMRVS